MEEKTEPIHILESVGILFIILLLVVVVVFACYIGVPNWINILEVAEKYWSK